jgi:hypothetical protein
MLISKAARQAYIDREFQSYLWMKKLQERDLLEELTTFRNRPRFKTKPWLHQLVCFYIGMCEPRFLFLLDMGAGKTKILLDLIQQRKRERKLRKALVTVPRLINIGSWEEDVYRHSDLKPILCSTSTSEEKWDTLMTGDGDLALVDYQGLCLALCVKNKAKGKLQKDPKKIKMLAKRYNFIGMDESHKLKNHDGLWFSVMESITKSAEYVYATTGTLFGHDPEDAWGQFKLVDNGETFGDTLGLFRTTFFINKPDPWKRVVREFDRKQSPLLHQMIQNRSIRYNEREFSDVPASLFITKTLQFSSEQREHYLQALQGLINADGELKETDSAWLRMRQITSGFLAWKDEHGPHTVRFKENPKLQELESILEDSGDDKVVVVTAYTPTLELISDALKHQNIKHVCLYGGTKDPLAARRQFMDDPKTKVFIMNAEAGGTGLDGLQKVARYMVLYESPCDPITRKQVLKRIHRPGQQQRTYFYDLVVKGSVDVKILSDVVNGVNFYSSVIDPTDLGKRLKSLFAKG